MIGFEEAKSLIERHAELMPEEEVPITSALGMICARDMMSPIPLPFFANSAMDGYALASDATVGATPDHPVSLVINGRIRAGDAPCRLSARHEAKMIMTGAPIPRGADTVLEKEKSVIKEGALVFTEPLAAGRHIRCPGEELKKGDLALPAGAAIHPGTVGFLAAMGIRRVRVIRKPKVSLVTTGSELVRPGAPLREGKIYDSNHAMLEAALQEMGIGLVLSRHVPDQLKAIKKVLGFALRESDLIVLTGGVSVGEYDHVKQLLTEAGVETVFWKVSQKPGKPLYFGKKGRKLVFGLPGNPAAVFTCFYEYVYPAIRLLMGYKNPCLPERRVPLDGNILPDPEKVLFLKGRIGSGNPNTAVPLQRQQSHMLSSLCDANALLVIPGSLESLREGDLVLAHSLPDIFGGHP